MKILHWGSYQKQDENDRRTTVNGASQTGLYQGFYRIKHNAAVTYKIILRVSRRNALTPNSYLNETLKNKFHHGCIKDMYIYVIYTYVYLCIHKRS